MTEMTEQIKTNEVTETTETTKIITLVPKCSECNTLYAFPPLTKCSRCDRNAYKSHMCDIGKQLSESPYENYVCYKVDFPKSPIGKSSRPIECGICYNACHSICVRCFSCVCRSIDICVNCSNKLDECPICKASKYQEITSDDMIIYAKLICNEDRRNVDSNKNKILKFLRYLYRKYRMKGNITLRTFYSSIESITIGMKYMIDNGWYNSYIQKRIFSGFACEPHLSKYFNQYQICTDDTDECANYGLECRIFSNYTSNFERRFKETQGLYEMYKIDPAEIKFGE